MAGRRRSERESESERERVVRVLWIGARVPCGSE